jgi:hypothetical protein
MVVPGLMGLFLGWQALGGVLLVGGGLAMIAAGFSRAIVVLRRVPLAAYYALAALVQIAIWRPLESSEWWPGSGWPLWQFAALAAVSVGFVSSAACLARGAPEPDDNIELDDDEGHVSGPHDTTIALRSSDTDGDAS